MTETIFSAEREIGVAAAATCESIRLDGESKRADERAEELSGHSGAVDDGASGVRVKMWPLDTRRKEGRGGQRGQPPV